MYKNLMDSCSHSTVLFAGDKNKSRRDAVRRKTAQYLMKAEDLYNRHLAKDTSDERRWVVCIEQQNYQFENVSNNLPTKMAIYLHTMDRHRDDIDIY